MSFRCHPSFDKPLSLLLLLQDMQIRKSKKQMEMVWRGAESYGKDADVLACNFPSGALLWELPHCVYNLSAAC